MMSRLFHPLGSTDTYRALLFQIVQLGIGVVGFTLLVAGWTITLVFAITPLVVPLLIVLRAAVGLLARTQAYVAEYLLGVRTRPPASAEGRGFWDRGFAVFRDRSFWRQQAHLLLAWPIALVPLSLLSWGLQLLTLPVWYRWGDSEDVFGFMSVDSVLEALPISAAGLVVVVGVAHLLGPLTALARRLAAWALADDGAAVVRSPEWTRAELVRALTITSLVATSIVVLLIVIWGLTPRRVLLADLAAALARAPARDPGRRAARRRAPRRRPTRGRKQASGDPDRSLRSALRLPGRRLGDHHPRLLLADLAGARASPCWWSSTPRWSTRRTTTGSRFSRRAVPAPSTSRRQSSGGSSATCTTAPRPASSRSG